MKALVYCDYGIANLKLQEIEKPTPTDDQVLIRVHAASLNPLDGHAVRGMWLGRLIGGGLRKPKDTRLGVDYAGTVEAVGKNVTQFKPGDEVFGARDGALAQYVCGRADRAIALKPANVTFEQAGSVAVAAITALQGLRDKGHVHALFRRSRRRIQAQIQRVLQSSHQYFRGNVFLSSPRHPDRIVVARGRADDERFNCLSGGSTVVGNTKTLAHRRV